MSRYIDAEQLICSIDGSECLDTEHDYEEVARRVNECETVDAVKVVRCKDCVYATYIGSAAGVDSIFRCERTQLKLLDEDGFCSWAVAKARPIKEVNR